MSQTYNLRPLGCAYAISPLS